MQSYLFLLNVMIRCAVIKMDETTALQKGVILSRGYSIDNKPPQNITSLLPCYS